MVSSSLSCCLIGGTRLERDDSGGPRYDGWRPCKGYGTTVKWGLFRISIHAYKHASQCIRRGSYYGVLRWGQKWHTLNECPKNNLDHAKAKKDIQQEHSWQYRHGLEQAPLDFEIYSFCEELSSLFGKDVIGAQWNTIFQPIIHATCLVFSNPRNGDTPALYFIRSTCRR